MTREERLKSCKKCNHRKLDMEVGLICSLTGEKANFEESCNNFSLDKTIEKLDKQKQINKEIADKGKLKTMIIFFVLIGLSIASMVFSHLTFRSFTIKEVTKELIRFCLEIGLYYAIFNGKKWARTLITILYAISILISFLAILSFGNPIVTVTFMVLILAYGYAIYFFNGDKDFKIFFELQKQN